MVRRVLNLVYREVRGLHQAAYVLALFAFGSQLLALVRDRMLAHQFGAGLELDMYYAAFRVPDLLYVLFASTLSVYVLIPFVARAQEESDCAAGQLLSQVFSVFLLLYSVLAAVAAVSAPWLARAFFPELASQPELITLMQILLLQPLFLGISSLFGVVTQLGHRFVLYAISPLIYNLGIIFGIVVLEPQLGISGLAWGVVLGALGHMLVQVPLVRTSPLRFTVATSISKEKMFEILRVSIPRALTLSVNQIVLLVLISLASALAVGSVSVFQFAYNLQSVPLAVIGVSYSVAAFPILAELYASNKLDSFKLHITTALRHIIFWSLPVIALIIVLRAQIVRVVLGSGEFDWSDTRLTAAMLAIFSLSLIFQAAALLITRAFYAAGYTKIPMVSALFGAGGAIVASLVFVSILDSSTQLALTMSELLRVDNVTGLEVLGLAIGYSVGVGLQVLILTSMAVRVFALDMTWAGKEFLRGLSAAAAAGLSAYASLNFIVNGIKGDTLLGILIQGMFGGIMGIVGALLIYRLLRSPELDEVMLAFHRRLFKTDVVAPEKDML